jgi:CRISPR-associated protein Cmr1
MSTRRIVVGPPTKAELPAARTRATRGGLLRDEIKVTLRVVTPILGGAARARQIDDVDVIRTPTIRGHLRFWWRSLYGHRYADTQALFAAESALFGAAAGGECGRSAVEATVVVRAAGEEDPSNVQPYPKKGVPPTPGAYALWPARGQTGASGPAANPAPRRVPGTELELKLICPRDRVPEVRNALRAWILFGGYGSRTRRGVGSLTAAGSVNEWLPARADRESLIQLFGEDVLAPTSGPATTRPSLHGASLCVGRSLARADDAWTTALAWLNDFRQAAPKGDAPRQAWARERGETGTRPGRSNWPEADKVRRLAGSGPWAHDPQHNGRPAWPRAGFGLPIIGQFQRKNRDQQPYPRPEPGNFELVWREGTTAHDRVASPLIVKALPLADGSFAPAALWLRRAFPAGEVVVKLNGRINPQSGAPFDRLVADGDQARFAPLAAGADGPAGERLRRAFMGWLRDHLHLTEVAQ